MSFTFGTENSWVRVQNIGSADATVTVTYYSESGQQLAQDGCPSLLCPPIGPGQGWTFFQADQPQLPSGYRGSAVIESDQPIVALQAKDVRRNGAFMVDGDTTTLNAGSSKMYLPLIAKQDGAQHDWNGRFAVQNLSDSVTACVTITYLSNYTDGEIAWDPVQARDERRRSSPAARTAAARWRRARRCSAIPTRSACRRASPARCASRRRRMRPGITAEQAAADGDGGHMEQHLQSVQLVSRAR